MEGLTLDDMRELLRKGAGGLDANEMPDDEADRLLNLAFWNSEFNLDFKEKECRVSFPTTKGENMYLVPDEDDSIDLEAIQALSILDEDDETHVLRRMTQNKWDEVYSHPHEDRHALPERYVRMDETIILHPTPDSADYEVRLYFFKTLKSLLAGTVDELDLPRSWHEIVVEKAIVRYHFYNQDYDLARQAANFPLRKERHATSVRAKEENDSRYAGLEVAHEPPS